VRKRVSSRKSAIGVSYTAIQAQPPTSDELIIPMTNQKPSFARSVFRLAACYSYPLGL
jgi:hypothetical protein